MMKKIYGYYVSFSIGFCAKVEIPRLLQNGECSIVELSKKTKTHEEALLKVMRLLVANDIFIESAPKTFKNNSFSEMLMSEFEFLSQLHVSQVFQESWQNMEYSIKTGKSATKHTTGHSFYDYLNQEENRETRDIFDKAMINIQNEDSKVIHNYYDFSGHQKIYDIGGGSGRFLSSIKEKYAHISATLFETEAVLKKINKNALADIALFQGNFFESVPDDGELYILRHIIHNWNDEEAIQILKNCVKNTTDEARFLVLEMLLDEETKPEQKSENIAIYRDIHMLVALGGEQRTLTQFKTLFSKANLEIKEIILLPSGMNIFKLKKILK